MNYIVKFSGGPVPLDVFCDGIELRGGQAFITLRDQVLLAAHEYDKYQPIESVVNMAKKFFEANNGR